MKIQAHREQLQKEELMRESQRKQKELENYTQMLELRQHTSRLILERESEGSRDMREPPRVEATGTGPDDALKETATTKTVTKTREKSQSVEVMMTHREATEILAKKKTGMKKRRKHKKRRIEAKAKKDKKRKEEKNKKKQQQKDRKSRKREEIKKE